MGFISIYTSTYYALRVLFVCLVVIMSYQQTVDPSGIYFGSNASGLVDVAADNVHINETLCANMIYADNLTVKGQTIVQTLTELNITNPIIEIASNNTVNDKLLTGVLAQYGTVNGPKFAGLVRLPDNGANNPMAGDFLLVENGADITMSDPGVVDSNLGLGKLYSTTIANTGTIHTSSINVAGDTSTMTLEATGLATLQNVTATDVNTSTLEVTSVADIQDLRVFGSIKMYPGAPFGLADSLETVVPSLSITGDSIDALDVTALDVVATSLTIGASPAELIPLATGVPLISNLTPNVTISSLGNIVAYSNVPQTASLLGTPFNLSAVTGGNITASGVVTGASFVAGDGIKLNGTSGEIIGDTIAATTSIEALGLNTKTVVMPALGNDFESYTTPLPGNVFGKKATSGNATTCTHNFYGDVHTQQGNLYLGSPADTVKNQLNVVMSTVNINAFFSEGEVNIGTASLDATESLLPKCTTNIKGGLNFGSPTQKYDFATFYGPAVFGPISATYMGIVAPPISQAPP